MTVARIWAKHDIKPHRLEGYLASNDPDFETKAADVIGLYLNPPQHAAVFSVDEKTAIQGASSKAGVLSRKDRPAGVEVRSPVDRVAERSESDD